MKITIILLLAFLPVYSNAQQAINDQNLKLEQVAKYDLSSETTAYTFKLISMNTAGSSEDTVEAAEPGVKVRSAIDNFLEVDGVKECTFDNATQTFTVITKPQTDLSEVVKSINTKSH